MTAALSFDAMRDHVTSDPAFVGACKRYRRGGGSPEAIALSVLTAVGFPDLYIDALRYRHLRANSADADHLDQSIDAQMALLPEGGGE